MKDTRKGGGDKRLIEILLSIHSEIPCHNKVYVSDRTFALISTDTLSSPLHSCSPEDYFKGPT